MEVGPARLRSPALVLEVSSTSLALVLEPALDLRGLVLDGLRSLPLVLKSASDLRTLRLAHGLRSLGLAHRLRSLGLRFLGLAHILRAHRLRTLGLVHLLRALGLVHRLRALGLEVTLAALVPLVHRRAPTSHAAAARGSTILGTHAGAGRGVVLSTQFGHDGVTGS